ncbi:uncharacterized protein LOC131628604 [Vicia villosa]|uniref:uncharacterized protein LOC131628604 n=1 Tax=Vicia villosa TaxID=3911 RepID=UPI00273AD20D|nr:uncharacterized protein LOC131628604 [Vicia villosa]
MRPLGRWIGLGGATSSLASFRQYDAELTAAHQAEGDELEQATHRKWTLRCYFLYLIGTQLFVDTSSSYTNIVYLTCLSDIARIHEYNWRAAVLAYNYYRLGEGCLWKDTTTLPIHYWLGRGAHQHRGHAACQSFHPRRGNQVSDSYRRGLDRMAAEDISSTIVVRYRLERVMRQFGYEQAIPRDPTISAPIAMTRMQLEEVFAD